MSAGAGEPNIFAADAAAGIAANGVANGVADSTAEAVKTTEAADTTDGTDAAEIAAAAGTVAGSVQPRYLLFSMADMGLCALPVEAVQTVSLPDGPCRRVPGRGGQQSRFCGLVSVRGQVQLCFDMAACRGQCCVQCRATAHAAGVPLAPLLVAVAQERSLALRVGGPLQLVGRLELFSEPFVPLAAGLAELVDGCFCVPEASGRPQTVWVLNTGKLFDFLAKEVLGNG